MEEKVEMQAAGERIASALDKLEQALTRFEAQYEALTGKVDRIIAAVDPIEVKTQAEKPQRKTVSPVIANLLAKRGVEMASMEDATVEKALAGLSVEQRIAVKAELARAGVLQ